MFDKVRVAKMNLVFVSGCSTICIAAQISRILDSTKTYLLKHKGLNHTKLTTINLKKPTHAPELLSVLLGNTIRFPESIVYRNSLSSTRHNPWSPCAVHA